MRHVPLLLPLLAAAACSLPALAADGPPLPSGTPLRATQSCYDVRRYELALAVHPDTRSIDGRLVMRADMLADAARIELDLDEHLSVRALSVEGTHASWTHAEGVITIDVDPALVAGDPLVVTVDYGGAPRVSPRPPWDGGFTWSQSADGSPWIATTCQGEGADLWWPCKDQPSDEPDGMDLVVTVPDGLFAACNGVLRSDRRAADGTRTLHWEVLSPIANYAVALNIGPYVELRTTVASVAGGSFPFVFYVLPEDVDAARAALPEFVEHIAWFESVLGPYPFRAEKYGLVETPHLGMEHQTIVAYGNHFRPGAAGYDWLHHHEASHEWWANLVTARDWKDMWLHEGIGTYMQALYLEQRVSPDAAAEKRAASRRGLRNRRPVAPRETRDSKQIYFDADGGFDNDIYDKGACLLHTLRWELGDPAFFELLRRFAYPTPAQAAATDGSQCRLVDSDDFVALASEVAGRDLSWFFEVYLRQPALPELLSEMVAGSLRLSWDSPVPGPFPLGVPVRIDGVDHRIEIPAGGLVEVPLPCHSGECVEIDPDGWLLRVEDGLP